MISTYDNFVLIYKYCGLQNILKFCARFFEEQSLKLEHNKQEGTEA